MKILLTTIIISLYGLALSGCTGVTEKNLLPPTRAYPTLGIRLRILEPDGFAENIRGQRRHLLRIIQVKPEQPADRAGIMPGDILLSIDGSPVSGVEDSIGFMQLYQWGDSVMLSIFRDNHIHEIPVLLSP